ncbi:MAG: hypothetical protein WCP32_19395 [Bacteroidota bacterium]
MKKNVNNISLINLLLLLPVLVLLPSKSFPQDTAMAARFNLSFEKLRNGKPLFWEDLGSNTYRLAIDSSETHNGRYSAVIEYEGDAPQFRAWSFTLPGNYPGKTITLSGYVKTDNVRDGFAGLWIRIDPMIGFDNMQERGITGSTGWTKYELSLNMNPGKTKQIVVGGLLAGKGKMWLDDLQITIDGEDIINLKPIPAKIYPAEKDTAFNKGSNLAEIQLTPMKAENLRVLGLVWGFLKYYHPSVAEGNYNWDYELFRILPGIIASENHAQRDRLLCDWITTLGPLSEEEKDLWRKIPGMKPGLMDERELSVALAKRSYNG